MTTHELCYDPASPRGQMTLYLPDNAEGAPLYFYLHGGGLVEGDKREVHPLAAYLCEHGIAVASANYRLYPDARFPDFLFDAAKALAFVLKERSFSSVVVGGSSAGAYLSMLLCFNREYYDACGVDPARISGYFFNAGQPTSHFHYLKIECGGDSRAIRIDKAAPLFYLPPLPAHQPFLHIVCAERDMTNRLNQNKMLETALVQFGYPRDKVDLTVYAGETHCSYLAKPFYFEDTLNLINRCKE